MLKQIIFSTIMLAATAASAQYINFNPGSIAATVTDECIVHVTATAPEMKYLKECRYELWYRDSTGHHNIWLDYSCADTFSFELPFADTFKLYRRVYWHPTYGTQWKLTNFVLLQPCTPDSELETPAQDTTQTDTITQAQTVPEIIDCASLEGTTLHLTCNYPGFMVITSAFANVVQYEHFTWATTYDLSNLPPGLWFIHLVYITPDGYRDEVEKLSK